MSERAATKAAEAVAPRAGDAPGAGETFPAQVAGMFYPAEPEALRAALGGAWPRAVAASIDPKVAVIPHAGLAYCAHVGASAIAPWTRRRQPVRRVVLIGPSHRYRFEGLALSPAAAFATPLGTVPVAAGLAGRVPGARLLPEAFVGEHALEVPLVMLQEALTGRQGTPFELVPILVGDADPALVGAALAKVWGGPDTVIAVSSDLSHFLAHPDAVAHDQAAAAKIERLSPTLTADDACGFRGLSAVVGIAAAQDMRPTTIHMTTSAETSGDARRVVGYGAFGFEYAASARLSDADRAMVLGAAMAGLEAAVASGMGEGGPMPDLRAVGRLAPTLATRRATFVTIESGDKLRGCIGQVVPERPLVGDAFVNAIKAGFGDPRFGPLRADELAGLTVSVSILSHPRPIAAASEDELINALEPDRDGLILRETGGGGTGGGGGRAPRGALFLPSVWESLPDPRDFVRHLKAKAGLAPDHWSDTMVGLKFRTESFSAPWRPADPEALAPLKVLMPG